MMLALALLVLMSQDVRAFEVWHAKAVYVKQTALEGQPPTYEVAVYDAPMLGAHSATTTAASWARDGIVLSKEPPDVGIIVIPPGQIVAIETYVAE